MCSPRASRIAWFRGPKCCINVLHLMTRACNYAIWDLMAQECNIQTIAEKLMYPLADSMFELGIPNFCLVWDCELVYETSQTGTSHMKTQSCPLTSESFVPKAMRPILVLHFRWKVPHAGKVKERPCGINYKMIFIFRTDVICD